MEPRGGHGDGFLVLLGLGSSDVGGSNVALVLKVAVGLMLDLF